jgi:hypothetical protein
MIRSVLVLILWLPGLALAGWKPVDETKLNVSGKGTFSVQLPGGWLYESSSNLISASRDGTPLESITIEITPHKKAFKDAKKESNAKSAPEDLAEDFLAERQAGPKALRDLVVVSNEPAELAGKPAFRVHITYRAPESNGGAPMEAVTLGTALEKGILLATYQAPAIHFFARWLPDFNDIAKSVSLNGPPK